MDRAQRMLVDQRCSHVAAEQYGIITRQQALQAGLTARRLERFVTGSRWRLVLPGIYAQATASTSLQQRAIAAVMWAGPSAAASFETACALRHFADSLSEPIEVSSLRKLRSEQIVAHHVQSWAAAEIELANGIPITTIERTLVDMAGRELAPRIQELLDEALRRSLTTVSRLDSYVRSLRQREARPRRTPRAPAPVHERRRLFREHPREPAAPTTGQFTAPSTGRSIRGQERGPFRRPSRLRLARTEGGSGGGGPQASRRAVGAGRGSAGCASGSRLDRDSRDLGGPPRAPAGDVDVDCAGASRNLLRWSDADRGLLTTKNGGQTRTGDF